MSGVVDCELVSEYLDRTGAAGTRAEYLKLLENSSLYENIPQFTNVESDEFGPTVYKYLNEIGRERAIEMCSKKLPDLAEIERLQITFLKSANSSLPLSPRPNAPIQISYPQYLQLKEKCSPEMQVMLTSKLFLDLCPSTSRSIHLERLMRHMRMMRSCADFYIELLKYDHDKVGIITEEDFMKYVKEIVAGLPFMDLFMDDNPDFTVCYSQFIVHRFLVSLDPLRKKAVRIERIVHDPLFIQFVRLDEWEQVQRTDLDPLAAKRLASGFHTLDTDKDGKITRDDLLYISAFRFSELFVDRLVMTLPGNGEMNLEWFFRFIFMYTSLGKPWANEIMFDVLDIDGNGIINEYEYHLFFHALMKDYREVCDRPEPSYDILAVEAFDMCNATHNSMTKEHFTKSLKAGTFTRNLVDLRCLVQWLHSDDVGARHR